MQGVFRNASAVGHVVAIEPFVTATRRALRRVMKPMRRRIGGALTLAALLNSATRFFGICPFLTFSAVIVPELTALRFLTGLGAGSTVSCAIAIALRVASACYVQVVRLVRCLQLPLSRWTSSPATHRKASPCLRLRSVRPAADRW